MLTIDVNLDMYPELKADLQNIFCIKVSLIDLARKLEKDLLIFEHEPRRFTLGFKKDFRLGKTPGFMSPATEKIPVTETDGAIQEVASDKNGTPDRDTIVFDPVSRKDISTARHGASFQGSEFAKKLSSDNLNAEMDLDQDNEVGSLDDILPRRKK